MLEVRLLGQFDVKVRGVQVAVPYRGAPLLLAYLILNKDVVHSREKLAGILWPDSNEANARANLRRALYQLRRALKAAGSMRDYFLSDDLSIGFDSSSDYWLDVAVLEQRLGGSAPPEDLARAAGVYRSEFLPGYYDSWVLLERERLQAVFERRMHALLDSLVAARRWPEVLEWGERWIATGQVPEPAYRALMVAHAALGDAAGIASVFQRSAEALRRELGVEPSEQTRSLFAQLVRGDRPAVATSAPSGGRATTEGARETARHGIEAEGAVESRTTMPIVDWLRSGRSPLVGRDRELARAKTLWQHARDGEGKVLVISGEPGIGKSRLTQEVMTWVSATGGRVLLGECHADGSAPYAPLAQILGQVFAGDGRATARRLHLSSLILADAVKLAPSLRSILGDLPPNAALEPESELFRLYEAVALICAAVSRETPTLWVVEDVHWADSGTLGVVRHLARRARPGVPGAGLRLLMVLTHRDAETALAQMPEAVLSDFASERLAETLPLNRLSSEQTAELVAGWLGPKVSPDLVASIHFQAEGNPFFTEEICKAITAEPDQQQTSMGRMNIPHSVRSMVLARVERLPKPVQETLRWAALLGREFDSDTLSAVSGMDEGALTEVLELAGRAQLVSEVREPAMGGDGLRFAFTHALIPLALVESLGTLRQRRWHRRAAETVERLRPDDVEALAYHYVRAADRTKAIAYAHRAAKKAESLYAYDEAIRHLDTAAALLSSEHPAGLRLGLLEKRADIHWLRYDWAAALESYRAALELCSSSTEEDESVRVRLNRKMLEMAADWSAASIRARKGDAAGVARPARAALMSWHGRESAAAALLAEKIRVLIALARDALFTRLPPDWQAGADYAWTAVELAESSGATDVLPVALHTLAQAQAANSEFRAAVETATHQLALARMEGDRNPRALLNGLLDAGVAHLNVGEFEEALVHLDSAVGLSTRIHDIAAYRYGLTRKAFCLLLLDRWEPLLELEAPLEDLRRRFPAARTGAVCFGLAFCGSARAWRGEKQHAADLRQDAYDIMVELHGPPELWDQGHHY